MSELEVVQEVKEVEEMTNINDIFKHVKPYDGVDN